MKVDFHAHSTASDGTDTPRHLAEKTAGFAAFALTDHDNTAGVGECGAVCERLGVRFVPGMELSIEPGAGFDKFHLLVLGADPGNAALAALLDKIVAGRRDRNNGILVNLARIGIDVPRADLDAAAGGEVVARPHFANWLVSHGYAASFIEAFEKYLLPDSPPETRCYESRWRPEPEDVFRIARAAGGVCIMAHPVQWRRAWKREGVDWRAAARGIAALKEAGLDGIESLYQANTPEQNVECTRIADSLGMLKSAGSDYHGRNKPAIRLGMDVDERFIAPLLERLFQRVSFPATSGRGDPQGDECPCGDGQ